MDSTISALIRSSIPEDAFLKIEHMLQANRAAGGAKAEELNLTGRIARRDAGFTAYNLFAQAAADMSLPAASQLLLAGCFPGTELAFHQPLWRFQKVMLGIASINPFSGMPTANKTRRHGARLNNRYDDCLPGLGLPDVSTDIDLFVLLLTRADATNPKRFASIEIAALKPDFSGCIFRSQFSQFLLGYHEQPASKPAPTVVPPSAPTLKPGTQKGVARFVGDEHRREQEKKA